GHARSGPSARGARDGRGSPRRHRGSLRPAVGSGRLRRRVDLLVRVRRPDAVESRRAGRGRPHRRGRASRWARLEHGGRPGDPGRCSAAVRRRGGRPGTRAQLPGPVPCRERGPRVARHDGGGAGPALRRERPRDLGAGARVRVALRGPTRSRTPSRHDQRPHRRQPAVRRDEGGARPHRHRRGARAGAPRGHRERHQPRRDGHRLDGRGAHGIGDRGDAPRSGRPARGRREPRQLPVLGRGRLDQRAAADEQRRCRV
ncbi:MAG: 3-oxoacyl-[acyl-carrier protein] reductase, partial [uncultured Frankineae bacterium]